MLTREQVYLAQYLHLDGLGSGALYDGLRWVRLCGMARHDTTVSFTTATMFGGAKVFEGVSSGDSLVGNLSYRTERGTSRSVGKVVFRPVDDSLLSRPSVGVRYGFYSDLRHIEETGDVVGNELLVAPTAGELTLALAIFEGGVSYPLVALNPVENGDTVTFETSRRTPAPTGRAVFSNGAVSVSLSNWVAPTRLPTKFSVRGFFEQPPVGRCNE